MHMRSATSWAVHKPIRAYQTRRKSRPAGGYVPYGYAEYCAGAIFIWPGLVEENQMPEAPHRLDVLSVRPLYRRIVLPPLRAKQFRQLHLELAVLILQ